MTGSAFTQSGLQLPGNQTAISQAAHGFVVGDVLKVTGVNTFAKAKADSEANAEVVGIVSAVSDTNNFILSTQGNITGLSGLSAGSVYFLSDVTAGLLTPTSPVTIGSVSKPLLVAYSTTAGYFIDWRGQLISDFSGAPGLQLDYVEVVSALTITATSDATAQAFITGNPITFDGVTKVKIEFEAPYVSPSAGQSIVVNLYDGSTDLGRIAADTALDNKIAGSRILTPSSGSHTFSIRMWKTAGSAAVGAGAGGVGVYVPAFMRIFTITSTLIPLAIGLDGWNDDSANPWTYVSASTFTVAGDQTVKFQKGTRLKFTQTTVKYGVVASSAYSSGVTTVTIIVNTDYVLANAAISANYFSYHGSPQGYPGSFTWAPTVVGFSDNTTVPDRAKFNVDGNKMHITFNIERTSNSTALTFTSPTTLADIGVPFDTCIAKNASGVYGVGRVAPQSSTVIVVGPSTSTDVWTNSGTKGAAIESEFYI